MFKCNLIVYYFLSFILLIVIATWKAVIRTLKCFKLRPLLPEVLNHLTPRAALSCSDTASIVELLWLIYPASRCPSMILARISVTFRSFVKPVSKVERYISDSFCNTFWFLVDKYSDHVGELGLESTETEVKSEEWRLRFSSPNHLGTMYEVCELLVPVLSRCHAVQTVPDSFFCMSERKAILVWT